MELDFALAFPFALLFTDGLGGVMPAQGSALSACTGGGVSLPSSSSPSCGEKLRGVAGAGGPLARSAVDSSSTLPSSPPSDMVQLMQQLLVGAQPAVADEFQSAQRPRAEKRCANACAEEGVGGLAFKHTAGARLGTGGCPALILSTVRKTDMIGIVFP